MKELTRKLKDFLANDPNVAFAHLFGSAAAGVLRKNSDIDIAICFYKPPEGMDLLRFITALSEMAGKDVDVVVLNTASAFLRHHVMKHRVALTINDETAYRKFREKTIADYDEYNYVSGMSAYDR
ncbi:MAG: nucleotidyltransferase domain-containing protein [Nitrospirota bacterium]